MGLPPFAEHAPAKVNLFLHVTGRRGDGYHELDSLAVFASVGDVVRAEPAPLLALSLEGPFAGALAAEPDNLVLRAARALAAETGREPAVRLRLEKNLPVASGLGGGSADAAACLRLLGRLWDVAAGAELATSLGADVPVCLAGRASRMGGIGERLGPAPRLPTAGLVLVNPGAALSTPAVFGERRGGFSAPAPLPASWSDPAAMAAGLAALRNDLEPAAIRLCPEIGTVLRLLERQPGCLLARMSGSGATCLGLYGDPAAAAQAAAAMARPGWWTWGGALLP